MTGDGLLVAPAEPAGRDFRLRLLTADLVIAGGGMAGACAAITAARAGARVVLIQDRPVLGGNASSEIRLWILGATSHMNNNNRWAREGGVIDELLVENLFRNRDGNPLMFDALLLEKVTAEQNITLLLNTALVGADRDGDRIRAVQAFCSQNSTRYEVTAPLFCDTTGDGALAFLAGAAFRMGAEAAGEFDEPFAPSAEYGSLLGHSLYFYTKDVGHPVRFVPPAFALPDLSSIPRAKSFNVAEDGCRLWWIEWGGRHDTVHDTEMIKWKLWEVVYGVWNEFKNSGNHPEAANLTLEWVGHIPGKRESRRFDGLYRLTQGDIVGQRTFPDAIGFGGWSIDLHPADGVFSEHPGSSHLHARGVYQVPLRCLISRDVENLFLGGRLISCTHVAFGSTRVMGTGAYLAQAIGIGAALCVRDGIAPRQLTEAPHVDELRRELQRRGQHIPGVPLVDDADLVQDAVLTATSAYTMGAVPPDDAEPLLLDRGAGQLLPLRRGPVPAVRVLVDVHEPTVLTAELRTGLRGDDYTCDRVLGRADRALEPGDRQLVELDFGAALDADGYALVAFPENPAVSLRRTGRRVTGTLALRHRSTQQGDPAIGRPHLEFWPPQRRPGGQNLALALDPAPPVFVAANAGNGFDRPTDGPNAWVADPGDRRPALTATWSEPRTIGRIVLVFDADTDHPLESVLLGHPEDTMPFCVRDFTVAAPDDGFRIDVTDHHQSRWELVPERPLVTRSITVTVHASHGDTPASVFSLRCYESPDRRLLPAQPDGALPVF